MNSIQNYWAFTLDQARKLIDGKKANWLEANYVPIDPAAVLGLKGWKIRLCKNCVFYEGNGSCQVVSGPIFEHGSSRFFLPKPNSYSVSDLQENLKITRDLYPLPKLRHLFNLPSYYSEAY